MRSPSDVRNFVNQVVSLAVQDVQEGIPERDKTNTGAALMQRMLCPWEDTRRGDPKYARSVYSAAHWFLTLKAD